MHTILKLFFLLFFVSSVSVSVAQKKDISSNLAKPYTHAELFQTIGQFDTFYATIDPNKSSYILTALQDGVELEFSFNMILSRIKLFEKGSRFKTYNKNLPLGLTWGLSPEELYSKKYQFIPDSTNPFKLSKSFQDGLITAYLVNNKLSSLQIEASAEQIKKADDAFIENWGLRIYPDGDIVKGDCISGFGRMNFGSETVYYEGEWLYGFPNGKGAFHSTDGSVWQGDYVQGFPWGKIAITFPTSQMYQYYGDMYFGKKHGKGAISYKNGERYSGDWVYNIWEGNGEYVNGTAFKYNGEFKNGKFNGKGTLITPEGIFEGGFKEGKPHGTGTQRVYKTQATLTGKWVNGKKEGVFQYSDPLTGARKIKYANDIELGTE